MFGRLEIAKILVENKARVDPNPEVVSYSYSTVPIANQCHVLFLLKLNMQTSPFHKAVLFGHTEVALYLLEKGAKVTSTIFSDIVNEGYK